MSAFCSSEKRLPYWLKMAWIRASTSAWLSGESLGKPAGCCGGGTAASPDVAERRPRRSAAATCACSVDGAGGVASAAAGATEAIAEASAARRANSRREMLPDLVELGLEVWSIKISVWDLRAGAREEATESRVERQQRGKEGEGKEASRQIGGGPDRKGIGGVVHESVWQLGLTLPLYWRERRSAGWPIFWSTTRSKLTCCHRQ